MDMNQPVARLVAAMTRRAMADVADAADERAHEERVRVVVTQVAERLLSESAIDRAAAVLAGDDQVTDDHRESYVRALAAAVEVDYAEVLTTE